MLLAEVYTRSNVVFNFTTVLINIASAVAKITYPVARGWMKPFRRGLVQNIALVQNKVGIWHLLKAAGPLLLGTILEYGEWEILTLFISHLGPAEGMCCLREVDSALVSTIANTIANVYSFFPLLKLQRGLCWGPFGIYLSLVPKELVRRQRIK
jgi:hypothetical protein